MTALASARFDEIDARAALAGGITIVVVPVAEVDATATRLLRGSGRPVERICAGEEPVDLVRRIRAASGAQLVVRGLDGQAPAFWQAIDHHRDRLFRAERLLLVLSEPAAERLQRYAPNLASIARPMVLLGPENAAARPEVDGEAQAEFEQLAELWESATGHHSSLAKIVRDPAYRQIIAMGDRAIVPILRDLEKTHRPWGPALHAITGARPVAAEDAGKASKIADAWLHWARAKGYAW